MSNRKRFLLLFGSFLLMTSFMFTFNFIHVPIAHAAALNGCPPSQSEGNGNNNSSWVEVIQYTLNSYEKNSTLRFPNYPLAIDGGFGTNTRTAVGDFQNWTGISGGNSVVGNRTWAAMGLCNDPPYTHTRGFNGGAETTCPPTQSENSGSNAPIFVEALQDILNINYLEIHNLGGFSNTYPRAWTVYLSSDGSFGPQTYNAVYDWQWFDVGSPDGIVGPATWSSLYMCY